MRTDRIPVNGIPTRTAPTCPSSSASGRTSGSDSWMRGTEPYPVTVARTHSLAEIRAAHPDLPADSSTGEIVGVTGRVVFARNSGKPCFATLQEGDGTQLQAMISLAGGRARGEP